ncbi:MAG: endolytic transglycosylase MltG [Fibrobacter sp.]|jgi:UPF0755 protein|nr:endolytic transglycosylase MltG [Fibrobacter sp.]
MKKWILFVFLLILILTAFLFFFAQNSLKTPSFNQKPVIIEIPVGSSPKKVSKILHKKNIWKEEKLFEVWCKIKKCALKAGWFEIPPHQKLPDLVEILEKGENIVQKVTIPEGRASWEMPFYLQKVYPKLQSAVWDSLIQNKEFTQSLGVKASNLEGYLLPETYLLPYECDEACIIKTMVKANLKLREELKDMNPAIWNKLGGWHQVLTLASVVEEETGNPKERPLIAGVFHNRLRLDMPLGADPTVRFIFKNLTGPIYKSQLNSDNPYNTRKFKGLMPGPISNPGRHAIEATLRPDTTKMLYFVAKDDGSGEHFFSKSLEEHNRYKNIAAQNRAKN